MTISEILAPPCISIAVRAWNEEAAIRTSLESVFAQSLFARLAERGERAEVLCVANGCTDRTAEIAAAVFAEQKQRHPFAGTFDCRVEAIAQAGRNHTWNAFMHTLSHPQARFLYIMDSDIVFNRPDTLFNMYALLLAEPQARIATDRQEKDLAFKAHKSWRDRLSLATTDMTRTIEGQITGQLYCIRAETARRLYLPRDLGAPDDGFIKAVVCTDFLSRPLDPKRIRRAEHASHVYEAYRSVRQVLNNQKRQMIGQTTVFVALEYLKTLPADQRADLAVTLQRLEAADPDWLKQLIAAHLRQARFFWRLFPNALTFRFQRWARLPRWERFSHLPAALAGFVVTLIACARAHRHLRGGQTHYWPKVGRDNLGRLAMETAGAASPPEANAG